MGVCMNEYPLFTVFYSKGKHDEVYDSDFKDFKDALEFFDSVSTEFKQINRYDSYESPTTILLQTLAWAE
jgi:hypothetical protein